jgi:hypothetical protein
VKGGGEVIRKKMSNTHANTVLAKKNFLNGGETHEKKICYRIWFADYRQHDFSGLCAC